MNYSEKIPPGDKKIFSVIFEKLGTKEKGKGEEENH